MLEIVHANLITGDYTSPPTSFTSANLAPCQHAYTVAWCHVITSDYQGGTQIENIALSTIPRVIIKGKHNSKDKHAYNKVVHKTTYISSFEVYVGLILFLFLSCYHFLKDLCLRKK